VSLTAASGPILPGASLGMLGGGQLGRMFALEARRMGYRVVVLEPSSPSPAGLFADEQIVAAYDDPDALRALAERCAVVSTEFENVPAASLELLAERMPVRPAAAAVALAQDRRAEKRLLTECGIPVGPYVELSAAADLARARAGVRYPALLKTARLGYDGKGQALVGSPDQLEAAFAGLGGVPCVLEERLELALEVSVIVARGLAGERAVFPLAENRHAGNILDLSIIPARVSAAAAADATWAAEALVERLGYVGVLALECFVLADGRVLANEIAPRPHNSGHFSLDACVSSQFEQQVRAMCGLPLGGPGLLTAAVMLNLLGDLWQAGEPDWAAVFARRGARLHLYGKAEARPGRKMGHITCLADDVESALVTALELKQHFACHATSP
jgi:5-(carboxyamino)imidazole ribonucleotide synthase